MNLKMLLAILFVLFAISLLLFYWFISYGNIDFGTKSRNNNFTSVSGNEMQFYPNMRFPSNQISYKISECNLQKENEMEHAFEIMENLTSLKFSPVLNNEEISVTCEEKTRYDNGLFIAGEGGPTNITNAGELNVIMKGDILLLRESHCPNPNVELHELFHVLGFEHSTNPGNIMYNITDCEQSISKDMINLIKELYAIPNYPDLVFENVSAKMNGKFLDATMTVRNDGLGDANSGKIIIYANDKYVKEFGLEPLKIGYGRMIAVEHLFISQFSTNKLDFVIEADFNEINKENNKMTLEID